MVGMPLPPLVGSVEGILSLPAFDPPWQPNPFPVFW
jgi:hypothetical protein